MKNDTLSQSPENSDACCRLQQLQNFCISLSLSQHNHFSCLSSDLSQKALSPFYTVINCAASDCAQVTFCPGNVATSVGRMASLCGMSVQEKALNSSFFPVGILWPGVVGFLVSLTLHCDSSSRNRQELVQQGRQFAL